MSRVETEYDLDISFSVNLDANGTGWIQGVGPAQQRERWQIRSIQTFVANATKESRLFIFGDSLDKMLAGTYSGNLDTNDTVFELASGRQLNFKYQDGEPFATATITITGSRYVRTR